MNLYFIAGDVPYNPKTHTRRGICWRLSCGACRKTLTSGFTFSHIHRNKSVNRQEGDVLVRMLYADPEYRIFASKHAEKCPDTFSFGTEFDWQSQPLEDQ